MHDNLSALARPGEREIGDPTVLSAAERVIEFYEGAGMDYGHWSRGFNMHLGFYRRGVSFLDREEMLEQLNLEVAARLELDPGSPAFLIDLGCGAGAISRTVARNYSNVTIKGVTITPSQVGFANKLNADEGLHGRIEVLRGDYVALPFEDRTADGVWAVESACYTQGAAKENLAREMARVLKTGGRFAIADCFIKKPEQDLNFLMKKCYAAVCRYWALPEMPELGSFVAALESHGFRDVLVEDISLRVAPSLAHAPFAVFTFIVKKLLNGEPLKRHSINNLKASLLALTLGINRSKFSYYLISGTRG